MNENFTYSMILDHSEEGYINMFFPEFEGLASSVDSDEDPIEEAQDVLALTIIDLEERNMPLPKRKQKKDVELNSDQELVYVNVWIPYHRSKVKEIYTKKTLTIPVWLDILAKQNNINFSETLVNALKDKLGLH